MRALRQAPQPFQAAGSRECRRRAAPPAVQSRLGGATGGGHGASQHGRLIIPGQRNAGPSGGRLIIPGQGGVTDRPAGPGGLAGSGQPPVQQNFRPPPGFMDAVGRPQAEKVDLSVDEMLNRLRAGAGHWHQLARLLPALQRAGYDAVAVEEATGLERRLQNVWGSAAQVYESVSKSGQLSEAELALFDEPETEQLLYELRFLSVQQRVPAAAYVAAEQLSQSECVVLARAIKEHERRKGTKEGFADTPADALAYKHFRDALECRREADVEACVRQGLAVAQTDSARAKLSALVGEAAAPISALPTATLTVLRLTRDELGFRPVAAAGSLQDVTAAAVRAAPKVSAEGVFGNFRVPQEGVQHEWVGLPNWSIVARAVNPVALTIENCAAVPEIATAVAAKTEDARKRLGGVGLLVVDTAAEGSSSGPDPSQFYLLSASGGGVRLATGAVAAEEPAALLGPVLFLCRPPARDGAASQTAELLSV